MQIQSQPERNKPRPVGVQPGIGFASAPVAMSGALAADSYGVKPAGSAPVMSGAEVKPEKPEQQPEKNAGKAAPQNAFEERRQGHGNASTWMSLYKFCGPLVAGIGYGAIFGSPIGFAAGLSLIVSSLQAGTALKIHKEDTPWAKSIVQRTRKLMGRENDHSAAGKEWSMVPVWGAVCGLAGLTEASLNHAFAHKFPPQKIHELEGKEGFFKPVFKMQAKLMRRADDVKEFLEGKTLKSWLPRFAENWPKALVDRFGKKVHGNSKLGYLVGISVAGLGGIVQAASLAKVQERLDAKHAEKASANPEGKNNKRKTEANADPKVSEQYQAGNDKPNKKSEKVDSKPDKQNSASTPDLQKLDSQQVETKNIEPQNHPDSGKVASGPAVRPEKAQNLPFPWSQPVAEPAVMPVNAPSPGFFQKPEMPPAPLNVANAPPFPLQVPSPFQAWPSVPVMPAIPVQPTISAQA